MNTYSHKWIANEYSEYANTNVAINDIMIGYTRIAYIFNIHSLVFIKSSYVFGIDLMHSDATFFLYSSKKLLEYDIEDMLFVLQMYEYNNIIYKVRDYVLLLAKCRIYGCKDDYTRLICDWEKDINATKCGLLFKKTFGFLPSFLVKNPSSDEYKSLGCLM